MVEDWMNMISGCFGSKDKRFAGHPLDRERAIDLLKECDKNGISLERLLDEVEKYLKNNMDFNEQTKETKKNMQKHISDELQDIRKKFQHWLED
ncbi:MAG: hypothetical protein KGV43_01125 [Arcobacter sp.]|nr:hypothetical protein [Arcobacter sp.]